MNSLLNFAKKTARYYLTFRQTIAGLHYILGRIWQMLGRQHSAQKQFSKALDKALNLNTQAAYSIVHICQFALEQSYHQSGNPRVTDPLFHCTAQPDPTSPNRHCAPGAYEVNWTYQGMRIDGFLRTQKAQNLQLTLNGTPIRQITTVKHAGLPPYFHFQLKREVLQHFPQHSSLQLITSQGEALAVANKDTARISVPHGESDIIERLNHGATIDKKGFFSPETSSIQSHQMHYLEIYEQCQEAFHQIAPTPLFLMYGTLLGYHREGDFIPGDDDFDAGYFSLKTTPHEVKEEAKKLVIELVKLGYICSFNRSGRLFRLRRPQDPAGIHLDIRPVWKENDRIWAHKQACLQLQETDFNPLKEGTLRGTKVFVPANPEAFLRAYYGAGWHTPDPHYSNSSHKAPGSVKNHLAKVCITPQEYREMQQQIAHHSTQGKLIATGLHSLYPLSQFEADCGW
ncbi:LicD family protein [Desulfurispira natronophila]|uniref:LicD/FKTN/FKRP nucleotidyltransferase domain-containing protein n=1 Tax=Desulfurispira natronophila TaxID=682562 RepID=A0A7W8DHR0_9BACT|nr:LicD family protein [Desulfurispira natronophila]MBB5022846.1 hypothetical protein [Desulfurispira natronophila]